MYFTEKLNSWEFTYELLLLLLGAVIMSVMYKLLLRDCAVWASANGGVTQCFLRRNTLAAKKKKNLLVMLLELSQRGCSWCDTHECSVASFFCVITVRVQLLIFALWEGV